MIPWLEIDTPFPDPSTADENGILAAGGDLSPRRMLQAYRHGIFPWFSENQPILWWSTNPRMVLRTDQFVVSRSLHKILRKVHRSLTSDQRWQIRFDFAFEQVMRACAAPRDGEANTWISESIITAYHTLHKLGYAHSSEVWFDGKLVGGAYGVSIGRMFYGESMFSLISNASKIALTYLVHFLREQKVAVIDCQQQTGHLASLGAQPITRHAFLHELQLAIDYPQIHHWRPLPLFSD